MRVVQRVTNDRGASPLSLPLPRSRTLKNASGLYAAFLTAWYSAKWSLRLARMSARTAGSSTRHTNRCAGLGGIDDTNSRVA